MPKVSDQNTIFVCNFSTVAQNLHWHKNFLLHCNQNLENCFLSRKPIFLHEKVKLSIDNRELMLAAEIDRILIGRMELARFSRDIAKTLTVLSFLNGRDWKTYDKYTLLSFHRLKID